MAGIWDWFVTGAGNSGAAHGLFQEGQTRKSLNNNARDVLGAVRTWANDPGWIVYGDGDGPATFAYVSANSFTVAGADVTSAYHNGRRIKATGSSTGTIFGTILSSAFSTDTTVVVDWDDLEGLASETLTIYLAAAPHLNTQLPRHAANGPNLLPNGQFVVWQRVQDAQGGIVDDSYTFDGCIALSNGNGIFALAQRTDDKPAGAPYALRATVSTQNKKFGFLFPIEQADSLNVLGGVASLSFKAKVGSGNSTLATIRAAILTWSSTADTITSDVVSGTNWAAADTNPTLASNWTYENTPATITLDSTWRTFRINNIAIDTASGANVAVFIWVNDTDATATDTLWLADVKLEEGAVATAIVREPRSDHLRRCMRYFQKSYSQAVALGTATSAGQLDGRKPNTSTVITNLGVRFPVVMRVAPSVTLYSPSTGDSARVRNETVAEDKAAAAASVGDAGFVIYLNSSNNSDDQITAHYAATAEL